MEKYNDLTSLQEGEWAIVQTLLPCGNMRRRLQDIGLICGTRVTCLQKSPLGDPIAYQIRGAVIALRREDCAKVLISPVSAF